MCRTGNEVVDEPRQRQTHGHPRAVPSEVFPRGLTYTGHVQQLLQYSRAKSHGGSQGPSAWLVGVENGASRISTEGDGRADRKMGQFVWPPPIVRRLRSSWKTQRTPQS